MTADQFKEFWESNYPETIPISHFFKHDYPDRWFRIHSLPESKRYAEDKQEWNILLHRQNTIITDLLGNGVPFFIVTGDYSYSNSTDVSTFLNAETALKRLAFFPLYTIDMNKLNPAEYEKGTIYRPVIAKETWTPGTFNSLLKNIANDNLRAFFIGVHQECLIAPYDGGIDLILKDKSKKEFYKSKYQEWLSKREDGL
jgi:hypothetical protein